MPRPGGSRRRARGRSAPVGLRLQVGGGNAAGELLELLRGAARGVRIARGEADRAGRIEQVRAVVERRIRTEAPGDAGDRRRSAPLLQAEQGEPRLRVATRVSGRPVRLLGLIRAAREPQQLRIPVEGFARRSADARRTQLLKDRSSLRPRAADSQQRRPMQQA